MNGLTAKRENSSGFSLVELIVSLTVLLVVLSIALLLFTDMVKLNRRELSVVDRDILVKNALTLMSSEIEQAGSNPDPKTALPSITSSSAVGGTTLSVNRTEGLNIGNTVLIDSGSNLEAAVIASVNRTDGDPTMPGTVALSTALTKAHTTGTQLRTENLPIEGGVLYAPPAGRPAWSSNGNTLRIFGDLNETGAFHYSEYRFVATSSTRGRLVRISEPVTGLTLPPTTSATFKQTFLLLQDVLIIPGAVPIFQYLRDDQNNITAVVITLTVQAEGSAKAPKTTYRLTITSRNIAGASAMRRNLESNADNLLSVPQYVRDLAQWTPS